MQLDNTIILTLSCILDIENNTIDAAKTVECGTFKQKVSNEGPLPISLTCEKCMPYGKYVILQNGAGVGDVLRIAEIAIYGIKMNL